MAKFIISIILSAIATISVYALEQQDTIKTHELEEIVVNASSEDVNIEYEIDIYNVVLCNDFSES